MDQRDIPTDRRPIGFWLKLLDRLIDEQFTATFGQWRLSRRHWQVLNVLQQGDSTAAAIDERVRPFLDASEPTTQPIVDDLIDRGWASRLDGYVSLTADGTAALERLRRDVSQNRAALAAGITPDDYATTVAGLQRMARNLGWADSD